MKKSKKEENLSGIWYNGVTKQTLTKRKDISSDYNIEIYDNILYNIGDEDSNVLAIQKRLDDLGYLSINPTGYFGESTADALKIFQTNNELSRRDGVADKETLKRLFSTSAFSNLSDVRKNTSTQNNSEISTEVSTFSTVISEE